MKLHQVAAQVSKSIRVSSDRSEDWQRVNSYIADVLKDSHVLYAKLARLQGDFAGEEAESLQSISEKVLLIGDDLSKFSKSFYTGQYDMVQSDFSYGNQGGPVAPQPPAQQPAPAPAPAPEPAPEAEETEEDDSEYDVDVEVESE